ncbi:hypothetical protein BTN45_21690 [Rhizobium sp. ZX09]|nr:hypothetical protein BTN45_21690 [Rhizobium sp. ZX09]
MVAIVNLRFPFPSPHHAVSMAIGRPEAIDGAPLAQGPRRSCALGVRMGLDSQGGLSCCARNDGAAGRGRKFDAAVAA